MSDDQAVSGGVMKGKEVEAVKCNSNSSSTIGRPSPGSDDDGSADEVQSKPTGGPLDCLAALENSLPMKRGLSSHYTGKSKSFQNLLPNENPGIGNMATVGKEEHSVNKKRRLQLSHNYLYKKKTIGSCSSEMTPSRSSSGPLNDDDDGEKSGENDDDLHEQDQRKSEG